MIAIPGHLDCTVADTGEKLSLFYHTHRELFDCETPEMPVRMIMCAAKEPLSIQIHPDDDYALAHEGMRGKPEGSLVLECDEDFRMLHGHFAKTLEEFKALAGARDWKTLCRYIRPRTGEYIHIPHGTLHAFGPGAVVIAFSVNGDVTYRLYDYERWSPGYRENAAHPPGGRVRQRQYSRQAGGALSGVPEETDGCRIFRYPRPSRAFTAAGRVQAAGSGDFSGWRNFTSSPV